MGAPPRDRRTARSRGLGPDRNLPDRVDEELGERGRERVVAIGARVVTADRYAAHIRDGEDLTQYEREVLHRRTADGRERDRGELARIDDVDIHVHPDRASTRPRDETRRLGMLAVECDPQHARSVEVGDLAAVE